MPCSAFRRPGNGFRCSSRKPLGQVLYEQMRDSHGGVYQNQAFSGPTAARWFAMAMMFARAHAELERAGNQADALQLWDLLLAMEDTYGITPDATATLASRRQAVFAAQQLTLGPKRGNVIYQLQTALGSDFVAYVTSPQSPGVNWASNPALTQRSSPALPDTQGIFDDPPLWKTIQLTTNTLGSLIGYVHTAGDTSDLVVGDQLVVQPGDFGMQEKITILTHTPGSFTANFVHPHEIGTIAIRRPWPFWQSTQKHSCVVVKRGRATDQKVRQTVRNVLTKLLGNTSTWDVVEENAVPGSAGPAIPGSWKLGIMPLQKVTY